MPATLQEVKRKINSTKKTGQITGAMQMISTVKLSQIQSQTHNYQVYASKVQNVITHLAKTHLAPKPSKTEAKSQSSLANDTSTTKKFNSQTFEGINLPMLVQRPVQHIGLIVITSDRGLVGGYNSNVLKQTMDLIQKLNCPKDKIKIIAIGRTGLEFFKKRGYNVAYAHTGVSDIPKFRNILPVVRDIIGMYEEGTYDELYVCYNHFINMLTSEFRAEKMLPISTSNLVKEADKEDVSEDTNKFDQHYDTEPSEAQILEVLLPQYAESLIYGAVLDAKTAEHASSATAMRSATDNANEIISTLQLQYNRARQAAITTEITEITGAQAALE